MTDPTNARDDDLRRLLHDAVADVQPYGTFDDIRSRTEVTPMKRWFFPALAVAAVMAAIVGGGFWLLSNDDERLAPSGTPSGTVGTPEQTPAGPADMKERAVPVYYVGETSHGKRLFREFHRASVCGTADCMTVKAIGEVLTADPSDPDYSSLWPRYDGQWGESFEGGVLTIDLTGDLRDRPSGMSQADAELAIQQLVFTAQAGLGQGRVPVQLLLDHKHTDSVLGVPAAEPLSAGNADDVLAPVQVDTPGDGTEVSGTFTVTGRAATFEANVVWELKQGDKVVKHGYTQAQECCTLSPYTFTVTAPAGTYTLVVHDTDESGGDGPVDEDTKEITVK